MSICIISDHIIMLRQKFHYNTQHIDQVKPKYEGGGGGGGGFSPQSPPPPPPPPGSAPVKSTRTASGGSFMYVMNKRGSKILPCVTPNSTRSRQELCS